MHRNGALVPHQLLPDEREDGRGDDKREAALRSKKARAAAAARWSGCVEDEGGVVFEEDETTGALGPGMASARRTAMRKRAPGFPSP